MQSTPVVKDLLAVATAKTNGQMTALFHWVRILQI